MITRFTPPRFMFLFSVIVACLLRPGLAVDVNINGGQTSVLLDTGTLSSVGLNVTGVSPAVIAPGNLGADSVAFSINPRNATLPLLPTTFSYDSDDFLGTFSGAIEHEGSVFFNDAVEVGNFKIGFDAGRVSATTSGFFVESTVGVAAILFDVGPPTSLSATATALDVQGDLLVSPEFANFLTRTDLIGADVGDAFVQAVPEPSSLSLLVACGLALWGIGRRRAR